MALEVMGKCKLTCCSHNGYSRIVRRMGGSKLQNKRGLPLFFTQKKQPGPLRLCSLVTFIFAERGRLSHVFQREAQTAHRVKRSMQWVTPNQGLCGHCVSARIEDQPCCMSWSNQLGEQINKPVWTGAPHRYGDFIERLYSSRCTALQFLPPRLNSSQVAGWNAAIKKYKWYVKCSRLWI